MKADEPPTPVVKYGMAASEQHRLVERHFAVGLEQKAISAAHFAHALRVGPSLRAAMDKIGKKPEPAVPHSDPSAGPTHEVAVPGLRELLGLA